MALKRDNGWERWRGEMTERVGNLADGQGRIEAAIKELATRVEEHAATAANTATAAAAAMSDHQRSDDEAFAVLRTKITSLRVKVGLLMAGVGGVIGMFVHKVFGG